MLIGSFSVAIEKAHRDKDAGVLLHDLDLSGQVVAEVTGFDLGASTDSVVAPEKYVVLEG